jgi:mannosyl-3-phosphoglycerate phosphatase
MHLPPFIIIFTDLDGTLLDVDTYSWDNAEPAIALCRRLNIPIVLVSSKTRAEIGLIKQDLSLSAPFITENGGGVFFPEDDFRKSLLPDTVLDNGAIKWSLGLSYDRLVKGLREIRNELGLDLKGFSDMSIDEIAHYTGLDYRASELAAIREYDEPFIVLEEDPFDIEVLSRAAQKRGLTIIEGGRFYHLQGQCDKGKAVEKLSRWYKQIYGEIITIGLGDSPNDFPMLECVDIPILVRSTRDFSWLRQRAPNLKVTDETGPKGWNMAVLELVGRLAKPPA